MKIKWLFLLAFSTLLLASCASQHISSTELAYSNRVAVVSALKGQFTRQFVGLTIPTNKTDKVNVSEWDIDTYIENNLNEKLRRSGKTPVSLSRRDYASISRHGKLLPESFPSKINADLIIIVTPVYQEGNYPLFPAGLGLIENHAVGAHTRFLCASIRYDVYSLKNGRRRGFYLTHPASSATLPLPITTPYEDLTDTKVLQLQPQVYYLMNNINQNALKAMGLAP